LWGAYFQLKDWGAALQEAQIFFSIRGDADLIAFDSIEADEHSYRAAMSQAAHTLAERSKSTYVPKLRIARLYAHANDRESVIHFLDAAFAGCESPLIHLAVAWDWDDIAFDPRFADLLEKIGLPAPFPAYPLR
jgi:hypothetical protein